VWFMDFLLGVKTKKIQQLYYDVKHVDIEHKIHHNPLSIERFIVSWDRQIIPIIYFFK
jgi:hypothetical protein